MDITIKHVAISNGGFNYQWCWCILPFSQKTMLFYLVQKALKNVKQTQLDFNQNSTFLIKIKWSGLEQIDNGSIKTMIKLRN